MASQLSVYQEALEHLGQRQLASITENVESRRTLDQAWDTTVKFCLEQGFWKWAVRAVSMDNDDGVDTSFGFNYAFLKPDDWVRTYVLSYNETFEPALDGDRYVDENNYWFTDADTLYAKYVSNHVGFGANAALWPETFSAYVALRLARRTCKRLTNDETLFERLFKQERLAKADALSKDAINTGNRPPPPGTWVTSRGSSTSNSRWDRTFR